MLSYFNFYLKASIKLIMYSTMGKFIKVEYAIQTEINVCK